MTAARTGLRIAVPLVLDHDALSSFNPGAQVASFGGTTMGTTWQVQAASPINGAVDHQDLSHNITVRLADLCAQMSHWEPNSVLSRFNLASAGTAFVLPGDMALVMACAIRIAAASDGAFDPAIGRLTDLWGLGPNRPARHPDLAAIAAALSDCGWSRLRFDPASRTLVQPGGVWLDLSGIAKGYAVDAITALLGEHGFDHALVEIGGEFAGAGLRPDGDPWWVELEDPPCCPFAPLRIALHGLCVATSGDYLRGAHTIDPRNGRPVLGPITALSVLHPSCMVADAWATALCVTPMEQAMVLARSHELAVRLVTRDGKEWLSPALQQLL